MNKHIKLKFLAFISLLPGLLPALSLAQAPQASESPRVGDFALIDHRGEFRQLTRLGADKAVVLVTHDLSCASQANSFQRLEQLESDYGAAGIEFLLLNTSENDSREALLASADAAGSGIPVLLDRALSVSESLGADSAGQAFALQPGSGRVLWQGPADSASLGDVASALRADASLPPSSDAAVSGCAIEYAARDRHQREGISYAEDVAPILERRCVSCHNEGGIAPWAMNSHQMLQGWSPMIRETILTRRMPPGQVDSAVGLPLKNINELTVEEEQVLLHWIAQGSPGAAGQADPLAQLTVANPQWPLGEPDHILTIEPQTIPATGLLDYYYTTIDNDLGEDKWIRRIDVNPGNREVVHHAAAYLMDKGSTNPMGRSYLIGFTPGRVPVDFPDQSGQLLPADKDVLVELHYTTIGREVTDQTQIGLYFWDEPPVNVMRDEAIVNARFQIPPFEQHYPTQATRSFDNDIVLYALTPHMHYRGKSMQYTAVYPDGREQLLLSVPNYQFAWQYVYDLAEPLQLPAGSTIRVSGAFDNSIHNPYNPDPSQAVTFGEQTYDEMFIGMTMYRNVGEKP